MAQWLALFCAGIWALLCFYLSIAERPRKGVDMADPAFVLYRKISSNGAPSIILLIFLGSGAGIYAWMVTLSREFLIGALILLVMFPLSAMFVTPLNSVMLDNQTNNVSKVIEQIFRRWWWVHLLRTLLAATAFGFFLSGVLS